MTSMVDQIIQIANEYPEDKARPLIEHLLSRPVKRVPWQTLKMTDRPEGKPIPIATTHKPDDLVLKNLGEYTNREGLKATIYAMPQAQDQRPPTDEEIARDRAEMNALSRQICDDLRKSPWDTGS